MGSLKMVGQIVVYSIVGCPHCIAAKSSLKENGLNYIDVGIDRFPSYVREWVAKRTEKTSVPQIFFDTRYVGGNHELQVIFKDSALKEELVQFLNNPDNPGEKPLLPHPSEALGLEESTEELSCEQDVLVHLIIQAKQQGLFANHKKGWFSSGVADSVKGSALLNWFVEKQALDKDKAELRLKEALERGIIEGLDAGERFVADESLYRYGLTLAHGLNTEMTAECVTQPAGTISQTIRKLTLKLFAEFLSEDGKYVDYKGMSTSPLWDKFKTLVTQLQRIEIASLSSDERLAFFINIYNVLVIHGIVERGVPTSMYSRYKFFSSVSYMIGGLSYSLNDIENGILRSNRSSMATLYKKPFKDGDPRLSVALEQVEPRIHFALNCGAKSCPPIKTFTGEEVQQELQLAARSYLESEDALIVDVEKKTIKVSQLLDWYKEDFGTNQEEVLKWIGQYVSGSKKDELTSLVDGNQYKLSFIPYDWGNNEKKK